MWNNVKIKGKLFKYNSILKITLPGASGDRKAQYTNGNLFVLDIVNGIVFSKYELITRGCSGTKNNAKRSPHEAMCPVFSSSSRK